MTIRYGSLRIAFVIVLKTVDFPHSFIKLKKTIFSLYYNRHFILISWSSIVFRLDLSLFLYTSDQRNRCWKDNHRNWGKRMNLKCWRAVNNKYLIQKIAFPPPLYTSRFAISAFCHHYRKQRRLKLMPPKNPKKHLLLPKMTPVTKPLRTKLQKMPPTLPPQPLLQNLKTKPNLPLVKSVILPLEMPRKNNLMLRNRRRRRKGMPRATMLLMKVLVLKWKRALKGQVLTGMGMLLLQMFQLNK